MHSDQTGAAWWDWLWKGLVGLVIVIAITAAVAFTAGTAALAFGATISTAFGIMNGAAIGGLVGGTISNYIANMLFENEMDYDEMMKEGVLGEIPSWIINIFRWLI